MTPTQFTAKQEILQKYRIKCIVLVQRHFMLDRLVEQTLR